MKSACPDPIDVHVGLRLKQRRRQLNISQTMLAEALGVTYPQIQKYECAANRISASMLFRTAQELKVRTNYFFEEMDIRGAKTPDGSAAGDNSGSANEN